ncbi:MAG TPA: polyphosphate kinase 1 [Thermoanaerobaculia bacterium]|nr:polyphosphate kinase 1 [Thermoanaerobaculia bacterium]
MTVPEDVSGAAAVLSEAAPAAVVPPYPMAERLPLFDRELSWLEFNRRVLGEAQNADVPLLERVKFLAIASNNLDEFLMIRVGEVRDLIAAMVGEAGTIRRQSEKLDEVRKRTRQLLDQMYSCLTDEVLPQVKKAGIRLERVADLGKKDRSAVDEYFMINLEPILTPLAIDPGHPFPFLANLALNLALQLESERGDTYDVVVKIPEQSPRLIPLGESDSYVLIEDVISSHVLRFFPGMKVRKSAVFRVIRNSDISIKEEDVQDLLKSVESELRRRERREVVWIEVEAGSDDHLVKMLVNATGSSKDDLFFAPGPLKLGDLMQLYAEANHGALRDPPFNPRIPAQLATSEDIFSIIRRGDILLHRPYDSFTTVVEFVQTAADDPDVKAIKQTLYRTDEGSPIVEALALAAQNGKQVTAVVELQARFDEKKNITWARRLEEAGVQVVYGLVGIKTHCKVCLVVRREGAALRRYVHLSTGNYNAVTARTYTDLDLFTCDAAVGADAAQLMNLLTGYSVAGVHELIDRGDASLRWRQLIVAPMDYQQWALKMIDREAKNAREGKPARITAKMNALVEPMVIEALYKASSAGVKIDLLVRGICCLVPGIPGLSENVQVVSVIDRFLEHSRVFRFENGGAPEFYISSGDWMPRNFIRRVEVTFPVRAEALVRRIDQQILPVSLADNVKAWTLDRDGKYHRRKPEGAPVRSQETFIAIARLEAVRIAPYEETIRQPGSFRRKAKKKKDKHK